MAVQPFGSLSECNFQAIQESLHVDCATVKDTTKTKNIFKYMCPKDMDIFVISSSFYVNNERPCNWILDYVYKEGVQKVYSFENARNDFKCFPDNVSVKKGHLYLLKPPLGYRIRYSVDSCKCVTMVSDLCDDIKGLNVY